jgi:hypothetical protein
LFSSFFPSFARVSGRPIGLHLSFLPLPSLRLAHYDATAPDHSVPTTAPQPAEQIRLPLPQCRTRTSGARASSTGFRIESVVPGDECRCPSWRLGVSVVVPGGRACGLHPADGSLTGVPTHLPAHIPYSPRYPPQGLCDGTYSYSSVPSHGTHSHYLTVPITYLIIVEL